MEPDVVARARSGDAAAFESLVEARVGPMLRTAMAILGSDADARDAVQDALVTAWRELAALRDPAAFDAWLTRILVNRCRRGLRGVVVRRLREVPVDALMASPREPGGPDIASASEDRRRWSGPSSGSQSMNGHSSCCTTSTDGRSWRSRRCCGCR